MAKLWWSSSCGRLELEMTLAQAESASHQGRCDDDVHALSQVPDIAEQLAKFDPAILREELRDYGAWSDDELADHEANLHRILWLAAGYIIDDLYEQTRGNHEP